jgi:molybdate-binding protein
MNRSIRNEMVPRRVRGSGTRMQMEQLFSRRASTPTSVRGLVSKY